MQSKRNTENKTCPQERGSADSSQDWVCLKCNNLNFSFRTRCNRCKVQSRHDNRPQPHPQSTNTNPTIQEYYYYAHYFYSPPSHVPNAEPEQLSTTLRSVQTDGRGEVCSGQVRDGLPSVSRLLKKCKDAAARKGDQREQRQLEWGLFGEEIWNTDSLPSQSSLEKEQQWTDDEEASEQFRLSVEKMII